jgi:hypothetical protein
MEIAVRILLSPIIWASHSTQQLSSHNHSPRMLPKAIPVLEIKTAVLLALLQVTRLVTSRNELSE